LFRHEWEPAEGKIVDIWYPGADAVMTVNMFHFTVEVWPRSGGPFLAEVEPPPLMLSFRFPAVGQVVRVRCDPVRKKARFDRHDPALSSLSRLSA
jgi:hypothetical protein